MFDNVKERESRLWDLQYGYYARVGATFTVVPYIARKEVGRDDRKGRPYAKCSAIMIPLPVFQHKEGSQRQGA